MIFGEILGFTGVVFTGLITWLVARMKTRVDKNTARADRLTLLEEKLADLNRRLDDEIATRRAAESTLFETGMALRRAVDWIREVTAWINAGCAPPPPGAVDIGGLEKAIPHD